MTRDSLGLLDALGAIPAQLRAGYEDAAAADLGALGPAGGIRQVVVLGMGSSGIVGDVLAAALNDQVTVPVTVLKQYRVPAFVGPGTLALALSYSGDTEEAVAMATGALDAGATLVTVASGGALAKLADARGATHVPARAGIPVPRAALGAMAGPVVAVFERAGLVSGVGPQVDAAARQLEARAWVCRPEVAGPANPAREVARRIGRTLPLFYGGGALGAVAAMRWKFDVNENAKAPAFWSAYPDLDHHEICGWGQHGDVTRQVLTLVELRHDFEHPRLALRFDATREIIEEALAGIVEVRAAGEGRLAQVLDLAYQGDWASTYLALDQDVDPGPIDAIAQLKERLGAEP